MEMVSPLPSSMDLLIQDSPDPSMSLKVRLLCTFVENNTGRRTIKSWLRNRRVCSIRPHYVNSPIDLGDRNTSASSTYRNRCLMNTPDDHPIWCNHAWSNPRVEQPGLEKADLVYNSREESLQALIHFQQKCLISDLETTLEISGESHNITQQNTKSFSAQQIMDLFPNYFMNGQS
ncbi:Homeobox protein NANOGP8 [Galemys pyrenaicus]|uniref:Homeobox protein NANOGP8 n=1 Tax=Galemys pyrenaicus TaxID=202257 RepID=A0A8J6A2A6_GALPY|nr:Homeobox protein NANOGP8 [Galemys pyrenaicus]